MGNNVVLRPIFCASVSGGKDSLAMLELITKMPEKYPLDIVVNFDLEIEFDWEKNVVNEIERMCNERGIKFLRLKPRKSWEELCEKYGTPTMINRWCNSKYKLDCKEQLKKILKSQNCKPVCYIGLCADEEKRFKYTIGQFENSDVIYPLAEEGITEDKILEWAKTKDIFDGWYRLFRKGGCMYCPMISVKERAYLLYKYPEKWNHWKKYIERFEASGISKDTYFRNGRNVYQEEDYLRKKYFPILEDEINGRNVQATIFDYMEG